MQLHGPRLQRSKSHKLPYVSSFARLQGLEPLTLPTWTVANNARCCIMQVEKRTNREVAASWELFAFPLKKKLGLPRAGICTTCVFCFDCLQADRLSAAPQEATVIVCLRLFVPCRRRWQDVFGHVHSARMR